MFFFNIFENLRLIPELIFIIFILREIQTWILVWEARVENAQPKRDAKSEQHGGTGANFRSLESCHYVAAC